MDFGIVFHGASSCELLQKNEKNSTEKTGLREGQAKRPVAKRPAARKKAAAALANSEERFRQLVENIREAFWIRSQDTGEMLYISPAYEEIWGGNRDRFKHLR
ncbi:MAG: PAS domain S-box protein [Nitrospinae bacterium]|nr:PAS domain S-box protein [Nitrospinota bacterium]